MTGDDRPDRPAASPARPADAAAQADPGSDASPDSTPAPRWREDPYRTGLAGGRPRTDRRLRAGCWVLIVILLLICCVLTAWLTDAVLDLRAITTGG